MSKKIGKWEIKFAVRDLLAERFLFEQFETVSMDGHEKKISEVTKSYKPGTNLNLTVRYSF